MPLDLHLSAAGIKRVALITTAAAALLGCQPNPGVGAPSIGSPATQAPAAPAPGVRTFTGDATGRTDVTAQIVRFIQSVPDGSTVRFAPRGQYRIEGSIEIIDRIGLTIDGNDATFFATTSADRNRRHWVVRGGSDITIRDMTVRGANPEAGTGEAAYRADREAQHGFDFGGVLGAELTGVTVTDVYGDFVYLGLHDSTWATSVWIHDNHFERSGRQGIALTGAQMVTIEDNHISGVRRSTFDLEPNGRGWGVEHVIIRNNDVGSGRLNFVAAHGSGPVNHITIEGNRLTRTMGITVRPEEGSRRSDWRVVGNTTTAAAGSPNGTVMTFRRIDGVVVRDNTQPVQRGRGMVLAHFEDTCGIVVGGNVVDNGVAELRADGRSC